jgi:hypothetical protein
MPFVRHIQFWTHLEGCCLGRQGKTIRFAPCTSYNDNILQYNNLCISHYEEESLLAIIAASLIAVKVFMPRQTSGNTRMTQPSLKRVKEQNEAQQFKRLQLSSKLACDVMNCF